MGNTTSEVASGVKAQINSDGQGPELYRFVDLKGGGEFIDVMRLANRTKDYTQIDALIREHIPRFLYNNGEGKLVTISEIVKRRNNTYSKLKSIITPAKTLDEELINGEDTKPVCWDLDLRGGVGEHILHICFLSGTSVHSALAKRLLRYFPRLIDDLYMGDEYYGENVLHIAIVNEEPATVKFLLDAGVDFTQRCCGKFFCPEDQKSSRVDNVTKECPEVSIATNYDGYCYFGEYPLSFAAVLQQEESVRLLVAKGADTNCQDSNGNTALHMCVIYNRIDMVDLVYELGGSLDIKNRQGLTPLTLAAVKARKEMFDHILQKTRTIYWQYGNVTCAGYPLDDIDTIGKDGSLNDTSALNIIVRGESAGHLDMMDGLIVQLLNEKWRTFIKFKFFQRMAIFTVYFAICLFGLLIRGYYRVPLTCIKHELLDREEKTVKSIIIDRIECKCHYTNFLWHKPFFIDENRTISNSSNEEKQQRFEPLALILNVFDGLSVLGAFIYLALTILEFSYQNFKLDSFIYVNDPTRVLFLFSCILTIAMLPARFTCSIIIDDVLCVFAILTRAPYFFFFCRGFRSTGPFVVMIYTMIRGDLLRFCLIFLVFMFGFTQALHVLFVRINCENDFASVIETFFHMFCVTLQQVTDAYENLNKHPISIIKIIAKMWFVMYIVTAAVLLVNMLIAMMGNTYARVNERKKEWLRQWAKIMLIVEQSVSRKERLAQQSNYSKKMPDGSRVLVTRLIQTPEERTSIETMRTFYYEQLLRHLEPERTSLQSKTKSIAANSHHSSSLHGVAGVKNKQDLLRNYRPRDSFSSFDTTGLISMLELAQSLILNEEALNSLPENKRPVFIYEWLCFLNKVLIAAQKSDIRECQPRIVEQLIQQVQYGPGPPIRTLIGRNLATLFSVGDPFPLFNTVNRCNDTLKSKDEVAKLATVVVIGALYERLGRLVGRSYEDTVQLLLKTLKNGDSQMRFEIMLTFERIINGLGSAGNNIYREIFKVAKTHLCDRAMPVRSAAAICLIALINQNNFMYTTELEGNVTLGFRALDGSNYEVRCSIAKYLAALLAATQETTTNSNQNTMTKSNPSVANVKKIKTEDILNYLAGGFLRGNIGFIKSNTTERIKGPTTVQREIRIGVTHTYVELALHLGTSWIEQNLSLFINHVLELAGNPRASTSHVDAVYSRKCITFILRSVIGSRLGEKAQFAAAKELANIITRYTTPQLLPNNTNSSPTSTNDLNISTGSSSLNSSTNSMISSESSSSNIEYTQHILICALHELSLLVQSLGTSTSLLVQDSCNGLIDTLFLVILNPSHSVRLSAAWCLRSITTALPSLMTPLIDRCLEKMKGLAKQSTSYNTDAMSGFALALQALLGAVYRCPLGIPSQRAKTIFDFADDLLRTATASTAGQQQSLIPRVILQRTHTAWHLLAACCTLGQEVIKKFVPRLVLLWRNVFPRSQADFEQEKQRGDSFTWTLSFNQRSGALCSMISFLNNCSTGDEHLITDDLLKRMLNPIENAILVLLHIPNLIKQFGPQLKASTAMFRLRLYELLLLIPIKFYEQHFKVLLRELVAEFTLTDNASNTTTSLLRSVCHDNDSVLLGNWLQETDYQMIEEQLQPNSASGSGALEHDETYLYRRDTSLASFNIINYLFRSSSSADNNSSNAYYSRPAEINIPGPLPLGVSVIDASILLYGTMFIRVPNKHRLNMLQHFIDIIKQSKGARQEAVQVNIFTAVLTALKTLAETKQSSAIDDENVKKCACTLVMQTLSHPNPILRCAAGEALGRLTQVVGDGRFVADIAQICFDRLKEFRDVPSRTGYSLALGCLHRYVGGMSTGQYLNLSVSILLALAQDQSVSIVQVWALHALALIADCGGQMFRSYVEPSLALILHLLLSISPSQSDVFQCCGRLLGALITTIGPELQTNTNYISILRSSCLTASSLLQMHMEPIVQAEAIQALQQLHLFAPRHVNLSTLVPELIKALKCRDLSLRRACVSCLRQLSQREAREVSEHARVFMRDRAQDLSIALSEFRSLEELLFSMLDTETDTKLCSNVQDTLVYMLQALGANNLTHWLQLCKDVLAATTETSGMGISSENDQQKQPTSASTATSSSSHSKSSSSSSRPTAATNDDDEDSFGLNDDDDDFADTGGDEQLQTSTNQNSIRRATSSAKWPTKVFAADCVQKLINYCEQISSSNLHFDYITAKERLRTYPNEDYLVIHLNTLITFSFMSCTSTSDQLRLSGLSLLKQIILKFAHIQEDIDLPGHVILEQYQAQVGAALRPAFSQDTSSHVTAQACDVCSTWISSGVAHDLNDLRRVHQLLVSSLQKFTSIQQHKNDITMIYSENALTIENLAVLRAWADVYNVATIRQNEEKDNQNSNLLILVQPELNVLIHHWLAALSDYAFLILPSEFGGGGGGIDENSSGGNFYSAESNVDLTRTIYKANWASIMQATTQWLGEHHYELETLAANQKLIGYRQRDMLMTKFLTSTLSNKIRTFPEKKEDIFAMLLGCCIEALSISVSEQTEETIETILSSLINLLQSEIATSQLTMVVCIEILNVLHRLYFVRTDLKTHLRILKIVDKIFHIVPLCSQITTTANEDHLVPGESFLFASLELLVCVLLIYYPNIATDLQLGPIFQMKLSMKSNAEVNELILTDVKLLSELITLCTTTEGLQALIPVILHLLLSTSSALLSTKTDDQKQLLLTINQFIENIFSTVIDKDILRCTIITIINLRTNLNRKGISDHGHFVQCLTSLIINSTLINLIEECIDFYRKAFDDEETETHIRVLQCLNQLFQCTNTSIRNQFIQIFTPLLLNELKKVNDNPQQQYIIEILKIFETLLAVVDSSLRIRLASLIIPLFINFLPDPTTSSLKTSNARLVSYIIERIQYLIPIYSSEFRLILQTLPDLRTKLESAIRRQQQLKQQQQQKDEKESNYASKSYLSSINSTSQAPSLPLRMDFSNFKSS